MLMHRERKNDQKLIKFSVVFHNNKQFSIKLIVSIPATPFNNALFKKNHVYIYMHYTYLHLFSIFNLNDNKIITVTWLYM